MVNTESDVGKSDRENKARVNLEQTTARVRKEGKDFEILVDLKEALKIKKGSGDLARAVLTDEVFHNLKSGEKVSKEDLVKYFGSDDVYVVSEKIIKNGEVVLPTEYKNEELDKKYKQVVDFLAKNAVSPEGRPYTSDRIMSSLREANINIKNKPIESQISEITDSLSKVLPIKIETKRIKVLVHAKDTGKAYGVLNEFKEKENWMSNGDLEVIVDVPAGLVLDFYDKLNGVTHGSALTEELK